MTTILTTFINSLHKCLPPAPCLPLSSTYFLNSSSRTREISIQREGDIQRQSSVKLEMVTLCTFKFCGDTTIPWECICIEPLGCCWQSVLSKNWFCCPSALRQLTNHKKMTNIFCKLKKSTNCLMAKWPLCCFKNCVKQSINKYTLAIARHLVNKVYCSLEPYTLRTNPINTSWHWKRYCPFNYYIAEVCALKNPVCCLYFFTTVLNQFDQG